YNNKPIMIQSPNASTDSTTIATTSSILTTPTKNVDEYLSQTGLGYISGRSIRSGCSSAPISL
ncbi:9704_t:CDS:1, partial [Dentiscutata erythropus]